MAKCRRLHEQYGVPYTEEALTAAARQGDDAIYRPLWAEFGMELPDRVMTAMAAFKEAAQLGHRGVCDWLIQSGGLNQLSAAVAVADAGADQLVSELLDQERAFAAGYSAPNWWHLLLPAAVTGCHLPVLQALFDRAAAAAAAAAAAGRSGTATASPRLLLPQVSSYTIAAAFNVPNPDWRAKAEWLMEVQGYRLALDRGQAAFRLVRLVRLSPWVEVMEEVLGGGMQELEQRRHQAHHLVLHCNVVGAATELGSMELVKWFHEARGCPMGGGGFLAAARGGCCVDMIGWLAARGGGGEGAPADEPWRMSVSAAG